MGIFGDGWSNTAQLWWHDGKPGEVLRLEFPSASGGRRRVIAAMTVAVVAEKVDLNGKKVAPTGEKAYEAAVRKGANEFKVEIVGSNPKAKKKHIFGLDYLRVEDVKP
jgi:hypothetical protein